MKLKTKKDEIWVTEADESGGEAKFLISPMTPKEEHQLLEKCRTKEWDRNQRFETPNFYQFKITKIKAVILDWEGVEDEKGKPLECSQYNKEIIYLHNAALVDRVLIQADKIAGEILQEVEEQGKNLKAGPSGPAEKDK